MQKQWLIGAICAATVAAVVGGGFVLHQSRERAAERKKAEAANVVLEFAASEVVAPQFTSLPVTIEFAGPLVAPGTAVVRAKASGTLLSLAVAEGSRVRAGQTLGRLKVLKVAHKEVTFSIDEFGFARQETLLLDAAPRKAGAAPARRTP